MKNNIEIIQWWKPFSKKYIIPTCMYLFIYWVFKVIFLSVDHLKKKTNQQRILHLDPQRLGQTQYK